MREYFKPILNNVSLRPSDALEMEDSGFWFNLVEYIRRGKAASLIAAEDMPEKWKKKLCSRRTPILGVEFNKPSIMGILNVTPDSFSDGGKFIDYKNAIYKGIQMAKEGADIIDVGGESTKPGSQPVNFEIETQRVVPVVKELVCSVKIPISIDTRKSSVGQAAVAAGASLINDISGFEFDQKLALFCAAHSIPVCVMHSQGTPEVMQINPVYEDVVLDIFDYLEKRIAFLEKIGISRDNIIADPGIGFGKTIEHNLLILNNIAIFHGLGVPLLLGVSRKGFLGQITGVKKPSNRIVGSVAAALTGLAQGVQIFRVHDVKETICAFQIWSRVRSGK